ncbi:octanoyl-[GcvH]:protein N-octanoyltransferase [Paenibacillus thermoaerophilus]
MLLPFAYEEWLCRLIGRGELPAGVHLWRHRGAAVLGLRDRRLPEAEAAMAQFAAEGWSVAVRNSGGALVPLDEGVVNVTLMLPNPAGVMEHRADFRRMVALLTETLRDAWGLRAEAGEIAGAYCPGEYDVSVDGRKFCGIAQRRQLRASAVQAFVVAGGSGSALAARARRFYDTAAGARAGESGLDYPVVEPGFTASLAELTGDAALDAAAFKRALIRSLERHGAVRAAEPPVPPQGELERLVAAMRERYDKRA